MSAVRFQVAALWTGLALCTAMSSPALAQKKYDSGASDTEIRIGNIMPYSGPASAYAAIGKAEEAYFRKVNAEGGINGRKIKFISYDDAYSPPKTVEQARKLVESDGVLLIFGSLGTSTNGAIRKYMNEKKVPQLFVASGASKWNDPRQYPWTMGWQPSYASEARIYAKYIMKEKPDGKIGVLYQNDDFGKDYLKGLKDGLGPKASMIVLEEAYDTSEPAIDEHVVKLKASGADVFISITTPKFAAQAIKKAAEINWHPVHIVSNVSASVGGVIEPAGLEISQGLLSASYTKDGSDPQWNADDGMKKFYNFLAQYDPKANKLDAGVVFGYAAAQTMVKVLQMCGDDLTRENVMRQAASLKDFEPDTLLPGIRINTAPDNFAPIEQLQMMRFKGRKWELFGDIISSEMGH
ncbi:MULTISPECIES: ABC transporter substrate-binding protein [Bradyrhizobium]|jgi:branched-chain amino acid transport system substrate-binding protein|uniref:Branched-chain amino acid ABC transporter substrate-binding protein n=1 Tax=Bradyrhizobium ottawaense TaxID=931866 RepID=A0A2U8P2D3_9BRAD|nr:MULTISPECIES: ABC transporter substrate-binding protein [Bradyrhizobium]AWL91891.1 branched-chain amino acid ABC transporter substrate-binding protein [Bradyrhizobium ottawaense]MBR1291963.1 ABC transporter substrate-binding protein [Bradyrhizobium ottawaense]MBR1327644.1 ABC transporter substrate-binding protein [Bradyrhizobium ottawaense]MBR1332905.1 ABC transporter substrate-binding protein [Bradyrhizobium ottawaense]MDA9416662.1 branched-chain amino acid ABC transporter substrate-bindin